MGSISVLHAVRSILIVALIVVARLWYPLTGIAILWHLLVVELPP